MAYTPKSAVPISSSSAYMPKSAVAVNSSSTPAENESNFASKITEFLGLGTTLKNLNAVVGGLSLRGMNDSTDQFTQDQFKRSQELIKMAMNETDPENKKRLLEASRKADQSIENQVSHLIDSVDNVQNQSGITEQDLQGGILPFAVKRGAGQAAETASLLLPGTKEMKAATAAAKSAGAVPRILNAVGMGAAQGSLQGAAQGSVDSENVLDMVNKVLTGGAVGGATSGALQVGAEGFNTIKSVINSSRDTARGIYKSTLKQNVADRKFYQQAGGIDKVTDDAIRLKLPVTKEGVRESLLSYGDEFGQKVDSEIAKSKVSGKEVNISEIYKKAKEETLKQLKDPESRQLLAQAEDYFKAADEVYLADSNKSASIESLNRLRKKLDSKVGELLQGDISNGETKAIKNFTTALREQFRADMPQLKNDFRKYELLSGLAEAMQKEPTFGLTNVAGAAVFNPMGIPAQVGGGAAVTAARSPGIKRKIASLILKNSPRKAISTTSQTPELLRSIASILGSRSSVSP